MAERAAPDSVPSMQSRAAPSHCGVPMEWKAPDTATMAVYSFAPADAAAVLPPLWRCVCGFQLDEIVRPANTLAVRSR